MLIVPLENNLGVVEGLGLVRQRPHLEYFLQEVSRFYDVALLTSCNEALVDDVVNQLDPLGQHIQNVILLNSCDESLMEELKNNDLLTDRTVIIKSDKDGFLKKTKREIQLPVWDVSSENDCALRELVPVLKNIVQLKVDDVEEYLNGLRMQMIENVQKGSLTPYMHLLFHDPNAENSNDRQS